MVVALDDLPPLLWHTELGQSIESVWSGERHRGAQLNRLDEALVVWTKKYKQLAFVRHFDGEITREMEDALLRVIAEYEGRPFPRTRRLVGKWLSGRVRREASEQAVYCAELLAITYTRMGLLDARAPANWFDPGRFWSGDRLEPHRRRQPRARDRGHGRELSSGGHRAAGDAFLEQAAGDVFLDDPAVDGVDLERAPARFGRDRFDDLTLGGEPDRDAIPGRVAHR